MSKRLSAVILLAQRAFVWQEIEKLRATSRPKESGAEQMRYDMREAGLGAALKYADHCIQHLIANPHLQTKQDKKVLRSLS